MTTPQKQNSFAPNHAWDRNFFLVMVGLAWVGILRGFGGSIAAHLAKHQAPYPLIVHFHGIVFVSWLVLFTVQVLLIRRGKLPAHRRLGMAMGWLALTMAILGPATALTVQHLGMNKPNADTAFLSVQFTDILAFSGLVAAGLLLRRNPSAHKRLVLLGTLYITDAGFARWMAEGLFHIFGEGFWGLWIAFYLAPNVLVLGVGAYDLVTRRRLHAAYVLGFAWILANQMTALNLYFSPAWQECSKRIVAFWP